MNMKIQYIDRCRHSFLYGLSEMSTKYFLTSVAKSHASAATVSDPKPCARGASSALVCVTSC